MPESFTYGCSSKVPFGSSIPKEWSIDFSRPPSLRQTTGTDIGVSHMLQDFMILLRHWEYWFLNQGHVRCLRHTKWLRDNVKGASRYSSTKLFWTEYVENGVKHYWELKERIWRTWGCKLSSNRYTWTKYTSYIRPRWTRGILSTWEYIYHQNVVKTTSVWREMSSRVL